MDDYCVEGEAEPLVVDVADGESLGEPEFDGVGDSVSDGDPESDGEVGVTGGVLAAEAVPDPPLTFGCGTTLEGDSNLPLPLIDWEPRAGRSPVTLGVRGASVTMIVRACCCWVATAAAAACSGVTLAGSTTSSVTRSDSLELSVPAVTAPMIWVFTAVASTPAASTPVSDSAVITRTRCIASFTSHSRRSTVPSALSLCHFSPDSHFTRVLAARRQFHPCGRDLATAIVNGSPISIQNVGPGVQESPNSGGARAPTTGKSRIT